ncbi:hypothetical protein SAMN03159488_04774 [Pseudomonas sp. NFIX10]|nr:hypothetical protein SAMN03159488_04774 [Pseudomonas sp. NFIX10]SFF35912.1 hypothetical protein SAMN03159367_04139 [Pseudomonas sp. NFACC06-1]
MVKGRAGWLQLAIAGFGRLSNGKMADQMAQHLRQGIFTNLISTAPTGLWSISNFRLHTNPAWRGSLLPLACEAGPCVPSGKPQGQVLRLLRSRAGASSLATGFGVSGLTSSRASSLSHRCRYIPESSSHHNSLWEPSLLAIAVDQLAPILNGPTLSRASPLPHGSASFMDLSSTTNSCRNELARDSTRTSNEGVD